ncbi:MAG: metallophosphoesterase [Anaerolineales bacterium]
MKRQVAPEQPTLSRRRFLRIGCRTLLGLTLMAALPPLYAAQVEPDWLDLERVRLPLAGWPAALDGFTLAQLTDLHVGGAAALERVERAVSLVNEVRPDLVVLTGDYVTSTTAYAPQMAARLSRLRAPYGVYAVLGNHDVWTDLDPGILEGEGITVLRDEGVEIAVEGISLSLVGVEDVGYTGFSGLFGTDSFPTFRRHWEPARERLAALLADLPQDAPRILLVHNPDFTEMLASGWADLALCGHTHGGQVRLPLLGAPFVPSCLGQTFVSGLVEGTYVPVYVSRGVGSISPAVRFNCRPEVTLLSLEGSA